jgi:D-alanyl-D-alanine carboxypeptidase
MNQHHPHHAHAAHHPNRAWIGVVVVALLLLSASAYAYWRVTTLESSVTALSEALASTTAAAAYNFAMLDSRTEGLSQTLDSTKEDVAAANSSISGVTQTIGSISGTVSTLQKLSSIDGELLKKYSKVYFLNENYTPSHLISVPQQVVYSNTRPESYLAESLPFLLNMIAAANSEGVTLYVDSAFRSFATQQTLKSNYTVTYGAGTANSFSADQGYSEHQLGTTVDIIAPGLGGELTQAFDTTDAFRWLTQNAHRYGFVLSYTKGNEYYVYEPWHWRFVGVKLATDLHNRNMSFYDMDQREIDGYLANLFDS